MTDELQQRVDRLESDKRWWKHLAIGFMFAFALMIAIAGIARVTLGAKARRQAEVAYREAAQARQDAPQGPDSP
jgi:hypothetical protein